MKQIRSQIGLRWIQTIANPEKFQAIIIDRKGQNNKPTEINIDGKKSILKIVSYY